MDTTNNPLILDLDTMYEPTDVEEQVFGLLTAYLPPDSAITPQQAADEINSFFPHSCLGENDNYYPYQFLGELWEVMFRIAPQLDYQGEPMRRYVALHKALGELPEIFIEEYRVWQDMPLFGMELHERWSQMSGGYTVNGRAHKAWRNINGLLIHFNNEGIYGGEYHALTCIAKFLEEDEKKLRDRYINVYAPVPALWFIYCSPMIYKACQDQLYSDRILGGRLWKGAPGYSIPRWEFWRDRFEALSTHPLAIEGTRQVCKAAVDEMYSVTKAS